MGESESRYTVPFKVRIISYLMYLTFRTFNDPKPSSRVILNSVSRMMSDVQLSLSTGTSRKRFISFEFRSDVYQFLFRHKGVTRINTKKGYKSFDSGPVYFTPGWDTIYDHRLGDGCRIHFPVEMKRTTIWSKKLYDREEDGTLKRDTSWKKCTCNL